MHACMCACLQGLRVANMLEGGVTPLHTPAELKAMGFHIVVYPLSALYSVTRALLNTYTTLATKVRARAAAEGRRMPPPRARVHMQV